MKKPQALYTEIIGGFEHKKVLLIGDVILDVYVYGKALGISSETPTIVAEELRTDVSFGGSSLVARNLLELGASVTFIAVLGLDGEAKLYNGFSHEKLTTRFIIDKTRRTTAKKRFWIDGYKLLQLDRLDNRDIGAGVARSVIAGIKTAIRDCDAVIISDNRHGMMTDGLIKETGRLVRRSRVPSFVDSQVSQRESNILKYRDFSFICLNIEEAKQIDPDFTGEGTFERLERKLEKANICVKLGDKGSVASIGGRLIRTPAVKAKAVDTCGAGDAFLSALSLGDFEHPAESLFIANVWAGLSVTRHGINPPEKKELLRYIGNLKD